jgi:hypothetical protein
MLNVGKKRLVAPRGGVRTNQSKPTLKVHQVNEPRVETAGPGYELSFDDHI